ncbi:TPA: DNA methylase, partial [Pseudomonas aeruginosa]|nr:DNA methylase [Pseudomonas aeruginosa]
MKENSLFDSLLEEPQKPSGPVTCLGMTFENDEARRAHFTEELRKKMQDPEFRKIEGFPIGSDEDILNLSDPPYYTACPNPWIADFIADWEAQKPEQPDGYHYHREPFAADVSEGKQDPVCMAHTYHTKVPYRAIVRYILNYTSPGDVVLDCFAGTGMTGVAAQACSEPPSDLKRAIEDYWRETGREQPSWGTRHAIMVDLSPFATFLQRNFNSSLSSRTFQKCAERLLNETEKNLGWMYETDIP